MKWYSKMRAVAVVMLFVGCGAHGVGAQQVRDPEAVRQAFTEVASRLDQGGDLMIVANVEGVIERFMADMVDIVSTAAADDAQAQQAKATIGKVHQFLKNNGFYAINALGMSSVPRADGLNVIKTFISRDADAAMLPLWRACVGGAPRELHSIRFLSADTELARAGTADIGQLWTMVQQAIDEIAPVEAAQQFAQSLAGVSAALGISIDELIGSIGADTAFGILFSQDATITLPTGSDPISLPSPALIMAIQVKDDSIMSLVQRQVGATGMPLMESQVEGTTIYSMNLPIPVVPMQLAMAQHDGFLLIGTTTQAVSDAITAYANRGGLMAEERFKVAFSGQPAKNNGMVYVSDRFGEIMQSIQESALNLAPAASEQDQASRDLVRRLLDRQQQYSCAITMMNYKSGVRASGTTSSSGQQLVAAMAIAPVGVVAGIALPAVAKAREKARAAACINNLRLIDTAKEQWAMQEGVMDGDAVDEEGLKRSLPTAALPVCPAGGTYTVGPIGTNPTCSHPEHMLP